MSKMGISSVQSYRGAQVFEAIGLNKEFVDQYFTWTASRIGGIGLEEVAEEVAVHHERAFPTRPVKRADLEWGVNINGVVMVNIICSILTLYLNSSMRLNQVSMKYLKNTPTR
jgi:glutamate synthase domain-containing protein 2